MADNPNPTVEGEPFVRPDTRALLDMLKAMDRPPVEEAGAVAGREGMRVLAQLADAPPHDLAVIKDVACPGPAGEIPCRLYDSRESREAGPAVLFLHGGGFVIGDLEVYHAVCTEFAHRLDSHPSIPFPPHPMIARRRHAGLLRHQQNWGARSPGWSSPATAPGAT